MKSRSAFFFLATMAGSAVMAQNPLHLPAQKRHMAHGHPVSAPMAARAAAVWENDFSTPSDWTMGTLGGTTNNWVIGTQAPSGPFAIDAIASTTAANGFALYDSDLMCGPDSGYIVNSTPIDLSAFPYVTLQFEQFYRNYQGHTYVQVSNDNSTWTTFLLNSLVASNDATPNPDLVSLPITSAAGGQATVWIRFVYQGACDYAWMVDDVAITEQLAQDLTLDIANTTMYDYATTTTFDSLPYSVYPVTEIRPLGVNFIFTNNGFEDATNVTAHISTSDGYDESQTYPTVAPGTSIQFVAPAYTPTSDLGDRSIYYEVTADGADDNAVDNYDTLHVGISTDTYARDEGSLDGAYGAGTAGESFVLGTAFYASAPHTLYGIDVAFASTSETGTELTAILYTLGADFTPVAETFARAITDADLSFAGEANYISFVFDEPYDLVPGTDYMAAINHFGGIDVRIGTSGISSPSTSFIYDEAEADWFYVTSTPMVRMNFNPSVGIAESDFHNGVGLGQNFPNPVNGADTRIDFSLEQGAQVTLELRDVNGKLVRTLVQGNMAAGIHNVTVGTSDLGSGVYFYTLATDNTRSTKRMTVVR